MDSQIVDTDKLLFSQVKEGNEKAFEQLFKTYYANLVNYAFLILKEKAGAEEAVQDMFFKIWENRESIEIKSSFKSYCFRAVHNQCLNVVKHVNIREEYKQFNESERQYDEQNQEDRSGEFELERKIAEAIESMPEVRKKVFKLSRVDGLKYREIAEQLGISVKTVEIHMSKALASLRKDLGEYLPHIILFIQFFLNR